MNSIVLGLKVLLGAVLALFFLILFAVTFPMSVALSFISLSITSVKLLFKILTHPRQKPEVTAENY